MKDLDKEQRDWIYQILGRIFGGSILWNETKDEIFYELTALTTEGEKLTTEQREEIEQKIIERLAYYDIRYSMGAKHVLQAKWQLVEDIICDFFPLLQTLTAHPAEQEDK